MDREPLPSSFRDPSGFLFLSGGSLYRQVNPSYREDYEHLIRSGLYDSLVADGLLVAHEEIRYPDAEGAFRVLKPERIPFISYPYEWCFGQLKAAALATLQIERRAVEFGMTLKDASAYNIQFRGARPVLVDTLSFQRLDPGAPWVAYRQFCQHFLAPLALMSRRDVRLSQLLRVHIDGIPLDLASELLPRRSRLSFGLLSHLHLHAKSQARFADGARPARSKMGRYGLVAVLSSLESTVRSLEWKEANGLWVDYYDNTNYSSEGLDRKRTIVGEWLSELAPGLVWDLGANVGLFSQVASEANAYVAAFDSDPGAVERHYRKGAERKESRILPLVLDLTNPSAGIGWANHERESLLERGPADVALALALIHHLAIGNNVPLGRLAEFLASCSRALLIEFVPKTDSQVQRMLATREDVFGDYSAETFEREFAKRFRIVARVPIEGSERTLYRLEQGSG